MKNYSHFVKIGSLILISLVGLGGCLSDSGGKKNSDLQSGRFSVPEDYGTAYTSEVTEAEVKADMQNIANAGQGMSLVDVGSAGSALGKRSASRPCEEFPLLVEEEEGMAISMEWLDSQGNPLAYCDTDTEQSILNKMNGSKMSMNMEGTSPEGIQMSMEADYLVHVNGGLDNMNMSMAITGKANYVLSDEMPVDMLFSGSANMSEETMSLSLDFSVFLLSGKYKCQFNMSEDMDMSSVDATEPEDPSCPLTHNNESYGTLKFTDTGLEVYDLDGNLIPASDL